MSSHRLKKFKSHRFWLFTLSIATAGAYWPIRQILVTERPDAEVTTSTLTVLFIIVLAAFGGVYMAWIEKKFKKFHVVYRVGLWLVGVTIVMIYLSFIGYTPRWLFPPVLGG